MQQKLFFFICTGISCRVLNTDRACEAGAMIEGNISGAGLNNSYYCISWRLQQKEIKRLEFSRDTNKKELRI